MDLCMYNRGRNSISGCKRDFDGEVYYDQRAASLRESDKDDNAGSMRKKLSYLRKNLLSLKRASMNTTLLAQQVTKEAQVLMNLI